MEKDTDIMKEFYQAMEQNRIKAYFQPQYTTNGFEIASAEALCRMESKDGSIIMPDHFIKRLEYTKEILPLDWYMVKKACALLSEMRFRKIKYRPVAVNLSRAHAEEWDAAEHLCSIVDSFALEHKLIEVEITETYKTHDIHLEDMVERIRSAGFTVAVDDFGSGYSSLEFIRSIGFDTLKLDRSFIKDDCENHKTKAVIKSIVKMADDLGVRTIVEGVENERQLSYLNCCGCTLLQGDFLGVPMTEERYLTILGREDDMKIVSGF